VTRADRVPWVRLSAHFAVIFSQPLHVRCDRVSELQDRAKELGFAEREQFVFPSHVSPAMMKTYSHIRRKALDEAAAVLEPTFEFAPTAPTAREAAAETRIEVAEEVTSQVASQSGDLDAELTEILKEFGSSGWTRTSNPPVNSRMLCH
jgi:hypothetical protein